MSSVSSRRNAALVLTWQYKGPVPSLRRGVPLDIYTHVCVNVYVYCMETPIQFLVVEEMRRKVVLEEEEHDCFDLT